MRIQSAVAAIAAAFLLSSAQANADKAMPYTTMPAAGDSVRLDGTLGGGKTAWAYVDRQWLDRYLQVTIDAASANKTYDDAAVQNQLNIIAGHVTAVPNGTKASVEQVEPFSYGGRQDLEVRVMLQEGPMRGREFWTSCAELVNSTGHSYLRM